MASRLQPGPAPTAPMVVGSIEFPTDRQITSVGALASWLKELDEEDDWLQTREKQNIFLQHTRDAVMKFTDKKSDGQYTSTWAKLGTYRQQKMIDQLNIFQPRLMHFKDQWVAELFLRHHMKTKNVRRGTSRSTKRPGEPRNKKEGLEESASSSCTRPIETIDWSSTPQDAERIPSIQPTSVTNIDQPAINNNTLSTAAASTSSSSNSTAGDLEGQASMGQESTTGQTIEESGWWKSNGEDSSIEDNSLADSHVCKKCELSKPAADFVSEKTGNTLVKCAACRAPAARTIRDTSGTKRKVPYSQKVIDNATTEMELVETRTMKKRRTIEAKAQKEVGARAQAEIQKTFGKGGK